MLDRNLTKGAGARAPQMEGVLPVTEEDPWLADQPGINFDAALIAGTLGVVRRSMALGNRPCSQRTWRGGRTVWPARSHA